MTGHKDVNNKKQKNIERVNVNIFMSIAIIREVFNYPCQCFLKCLKEVTISNG